MQNHLMLRVTHLVLDDREGNDCIQKLRCHCIHILHSDIYSVRGKFQFGQKTSAMHV